MDVRNAGGSRQAARPRAIRDVERLPAPLRLLLDHLRAPNTTPACHPRKVERLLPPPLAASRSPPPSSQYPHQPDDAAAPFGPIANASDVADTVGIAALLVQTGAGGNIPNRRPLAEEAEKLDDALFDCGEHNSNLHIVPGSILSGRGVAQHSLSVFRVQAEFDEREKLVTPAAPSSPLTPSSTTTPLSNMMLQVEAHKTLAAVWEANSDQNKMTYGDLRAALKTLGFKSQSRQGTTIFFPGGPKRRAAGRKCWAAFEETRGEAEIVKPKVLARWRLELYELYGWSNETFAIQNTDTEAQENGPEGAEA
ncbi:hypothetical protein L227DRAFT_612302 [Lentinus tigrinus ALCF2SS1-6]|uniref:Uncharacterized protein n=1 Tax=Lentinus tigrinus ALCF2SS1-6 TaxID=1328759 RepID=A0A5C2S586_9APHY|nr:hypothetical protein L227DRAFT_612302 [Lentinus tigrinus ALCF2SS1-6]